MLNIIHHPPSPLHLDRPCRSRHHLSVNPPLSLPPPRLLSTHQVPFLLGVRAIPQPVIQFLSPLLPRSLTSRSPSLSLWIYLHLCLPLVFLFLWLINLSPSRSRNPSPSSCWSHSFLTLHFLAGKKQTALVVCSLATLFSCSLNFLIIHWLSGYQIYHFKPCWCSIKCFESVFKRKCPNSLISAS